MSDDPPGAPPVDPPETQAGRRLDAHHEVRQAGAWPICAVCGFSTDDSFDRGLRHLPFPHEVRRVDPWVTTHEAPT